MGDACGPEAGSRSPDQAIMVELSSAPAQGPFLFAPQGASQSLVFSADSTGGADADGADASGGAGVEVDGGSAGATAGSGGAPAAGGTGATNAGRCTAGQQVSCACPNGHQGVQQCLSDGSLFAMQHGLLPEHEFPARIPA
jgi:hypothetical protein